MNAHADQEDIPADGISMDHLKKFEGCSHWENSLKHQINEDSNGRKRSLKMNFKMRKATKKVYISLLPFKDLETVRQ